MVTLSSTTLHSSPPNFQRDGWHACPPTRNVMFLKSGTVCHPSSYPQCLGQLRFSAEVAWNIVPMLKVPRGCDLFMFISVSLAIVSSITKCFLNKCRLKELMISSLLRKRGSFLGGLSQAAIASVCSLECSWDDISQLLKVSLILGDCPREFAGKSNEWEGANEGKVLLVTQMCNYVYWIWRFEYCIKLPL